MSKRVQVALWTALLLLGGMTAAWCEPIAVDAPAYISRGQVMVPADAILEWLGAKVDHDAAAGTLTARRGDTEIRLHAGDKHALIDGVEKPIDPRPYVESHVESHEGRLFLPLTFIAPTLKVKVKWDSTAGGFAVITDGKRTATVARYPLHWAAGYGHLPTVKLLIERGADPNAVTSGGYAPLHWAAYRGQTEAARLLLDRGAKTDARCKVGSTPLHWAASCGRTDVMELLLERKADMTAQDDEGNMPIHLAARQGRTDAVKLLLDRGADVNSPSATRSTPLHFAACYARTPTVQLLIERGAEVNARTADGFTPLHWAALARRGAETAELLRKHGAAP